MNPSLIPSLLAYCFVASITPGPANLCSLAAAINYGRKTALRQWTGLFAGFAIVSFSMAIVSYFIGTALGEYARIVSYIGAIYIVFLAVKILLSTGSTAEASAGTVSFLTGLLVQLTNVKIMLYCLSVQSIYVLPYARSMWPHLGMAAFLPFTGPVCNLAWLFAGASLRRLFLNHRTIINIIMATALIACAISLIL